MAQATEPRGLSPGAYEELPGKDYIPYVSPQLSPAEFTWRPIFLGVLFGIMFGAANAYLGLRVGLTVSTSIPIAVMTVAVFRALQPVLGPSTMISTSMKSRPVSIVATRQNYMNLIRNDSIRK